MRPVIQPTMKVPALLAKVPDDLAIEATLMDPLLWGPLSWPSSPVVDVIEIVVARAAAEAVGVQVYLTMGGSASSAKVPKDPAVEPHKSQKWIYKIKTLLIDKFSVSILAFNVTQIHLVDLAVMLKCW